MGISSQKREKFRRALAWVACAAMIAGVAWTGASCLRQPTDDPRPMTEAEAERLSRVNVGNYNAGTVAFTAHLPDEAGGGGLHGRIDWSQPLMHAAVTDKGESTPHTLVQAVPGLVATRDGETRGDAPVPDDGWSVRHMNRDNPTGDHDRAATVDIVASAMLALRAEKPGDPDAVKSKGAWLRRSVIDGATVDVFRAPLLLGSGDGDTAKTPEAVFWVDAKSRLRRVQFNPGDTNLASVDFLLSRDDVDKVHPVDLLGGAPIDPRDVTETEARRLAQVRQRNSLGGAEAELTLPVADGKVIRAKGYVDWRIPMVYLAVDAPGRDNDGLMFVVATGAATLSGDFDGKPPLQPREDGWEAQDWSSRTEDGKASELDTLLFRVLAMASAQPDDAGTVKKNAAWLREDTLDDTDTAVFEYPLSGEQKPEKPGRAPFRYWVGVEDDTLHRIEMHTDLGMAHIDLKPIDQPAPVVIPAAVVSGLSG